MRPEDRERKKAWKAKELAEAEAALPVPKSQLMGLFDFLDSELGQHGCDHSLVWTIEWATREGVSVDKLINWSREYGGYCDCEVLANVPANPALDDT